jgi:hypothetical protein
MNSFKDRQVLWKMHHAQADFSLVADTCRYILCERLESQNNVYYALISSVHTIYGRPFTQSYGAGKLDENIVPKRFLKLHKELLLHRHQVYAHSDAVGIPSDFGNINQVRFFVKRGEILPGVIQWRSDPKILVDTILLCESLQRKAKYWISKIQDKYFPHLKVSNGEYVIDLDPSSSKFLKRISPLEEVGNYDVVVSNPQKELNPSIY